ncbi:class I adenylate-forming enzyme family protein [Virgibacillus halodenitrificans]|uniref:class I adenylate-forming enzyme family protein n=1 Tax=Virgibacillus halodenitrificans TaxID=1482 RepID=UPI000EF50B34|nr:long-chain-fatty-acid--CoA ligase [Virgibacillus halodenitrificans]
MNSSELLARNARKYPSQEAVVCQGQRLTYQELDLHVNQFGSAINNLGISKGDKVALLMPNVNTFAIAYFAVQRIGAIVVPINAKLTGPEVNYIVKNSEANSLIVHELLFPGVQHFTEPSILIKTGVAHGNWMSFESLIDSGNSKAISCDLTEDDLSTILYTSGTTGDPKGVLFSYRNILTVANMICVEMEVKPESRILLMMPLSHSAPLHLFFMAGMIVGATLVLTPTFTPDLLLDTVEQERTTHFFGAPVAYLTTARHERINEADLSSMKWWIYGGAGLSTKQVQQLKEAFPDGNLVCVYGLTEAGPSGTLLFDHEHEEKAGSIGKRAALGMEIRIIDDEGKELPAGEVGEIALRGESNMVGYYNNPEATAAVLQDDWLRTGDMAIQDEDGYFWIIDRKKDMIITGGVNVYPKEIEDIFVLYEGVTEVAVIGVPHPEWGETIKAIFSATTKVNPDDVKEFLKGSLASYKIPRIYEQVEALPRNASGKILKQVLREGVTK